MEKRPIPGRQFMLRADPTEMQIVAEWLRTGTVTRDLFEKLLESQGQLGYLSKRILKPLLEKAGLWKLFTNEEAAEIYRTLRRDQIFAYMPRRVSLFHFPKFFNVRLSLRPVWMDFTDREGPRIDLHGY